MLNTSPILWHFLQQNLILGIPIWNNLSEQNCLDKTVFNDVIGLSNSFPMSNAVTNKFN